MGLLISVGLAIWNVLVSLGTSCLQSIGDFILSIPERTYNWIVRIRGYFASAKDAIQRTAPAVSEAIETTRGKVAYYGTRALDLISCQNGPLILRLPGMLVRFFATCISLIWKGFAKGYRFLSLWLGIILIYWLVVWIILPATVNPVDLVLTMDAIVEGGKALVNFISAVINQLILDFLDIAKIPINILFGFILSVYQLISEYFLGQLTASRLGNLKSLQKLKASTTSLGNGIENDNSEFTGLGRRLEQQVFGADSTFGGFRLSLQNDDIPTTIFASLYGQIFSAIAWVCDVLVFILEIFLATIASYVSSMLRFFISILTNTSCIGTALSTALGFGCLIGEFILAIINAFIGVFGAKPIKGCKASSFQGVPCYCSKSEGGFITNMPSCPIPVYACINRNGVFTEVEISTYNGVTTEKTLAIGPTREAGCPRSIRTGRLLRIGNDCRDICHLDASGEGWWINTCDETQSLMGHCAIPYNKTRLLEFNPLDGVHRERHLKNLFKNSWVTKKDRRLLSAPRKEEPEYVSIESFQDFYDLISRAYSNMRNANILPLDCSKANPRDTNLIHDILYNAVCVSMSLYDLKNKEKELADIDQIMRNSYPGRSASTPRRNLADSSSSVASQLEYLHYQLRDDFSWNKVKDLHIEYIDYVYDGDYQSMLKNASYKRVLNSTAHILMNLYRMNTISLKETSSRRKLQEERRIFHIPSNARTYLCPNGLERVANKISVDPENPGLESCKIPETWTTLIAFRFISYIITFAFYTFNPFKWTESITDCWASYSNNPETYPLTTDGINAMIFNNEEYLATKTFCFPLIRKVPRIPEIVWSFLQFVEDNCNEEYTLANGKLERCICPMYTISEALDDYSSQWIAFIPLFVKYRLINTYRTLQIIWTLFIPPWISAIWSAFFKVIYPSSPDELLYVFNRDYAQGAAQYWGTRNDLGAGSVLLCVLSTIQSPFYFVIWYLAPLFYITYYLEFLNFLHKGVVDSILYKPIRYLLDYITLRRFAQEEGNILLWRLRARENPLVRIYAFIYVNIFMKCGRATCPRRVSSYWCPERQDWAETMTIQTETTLNSMSGLQRDLLILNNGETDQPRSLNQHIANQHQQSLRRNANHPRRGFQSSSFQV